MDPQEFRALLGNDRARQQLGLRLSGAQVYRLQSDSALFDAYFNGWILLAFREGQARSSSQPSSVVRAPAQQRGSVSPSIVTRRYPGYGQATTSLVLGIIGVFLIGIAPGLVVSALAVLFGHLALHKLPRQPKSGRGIALAGLIVGYVYLAAGSLAFLGSLFRTLGMR